MYPFSETVALVEPLESRIAPAVIIVNSTLDLPDSYLPDHIADTAHDPNANPPVDFNHIVTLRAAIMQANFDGGGDTIEFAINTGVQLIVTSGLPALTVPVTIDGTTQPGYAGKPLITIESTVGDGIDLTSNSVLKGLVVDSSAITGIRLFGDHNVVTNCFVGVDSTGKVAAGNGGSGIQISGSFNVVGGLTAADRNIFSNNVYLGIEIEGSNNQIIGNYVGTDITGTEAMGNGKLAPGGTRAGIAVFDGSHNVIGGTVAGARNLVADNGNMGIELEDASFNLVQGNYVGTDITGTKALGNHLDGIHIHSGSNNIIGVDSSGKGMNLISGNDFDGVRIHGDDGNGGATNNEIRGNYIGTAIDGITPLPNGQNGVNIESRQITSTIWEHVANNIVGGTNSFDRNVISGNLGNGVLITGKSATANTVEFNYIGTDFTGDLITKNGVKLGNQANGIEIYGASGNTIGGNRTPGAQLGNVIAGNLSNGVLITGATATNNTVLGNNIGSDPLGKLALGNEDAGVAIESGANGNTIGGDLDSTLLLGNVISANLQDGVFISDSTTTGNYVEGNYIGLARDGKTKMSNLGSGVYILDAKNNHIGALLAGNIISGNAADGVVITGSNAKGNSVEANRIGLTATGTTVLGNGASGVRIDNLATTNTIGGDSAGKGNVIAGNTLDGVRIAGAGTNLVEGNYIGTDSKDTVKLGNQGNGVFIDGSSGDAKANTIGGTTEAARNIISGNAKDGVSIKGANAKDNVIEGNYIGTTGDGKTALPNSNGISITDAPSNQIGGTAQGSGNLISGNLFQGIVIKGTVNTPNLIQGNYIGTTADGTGKLGNDNGIRVEVDTATNTTIGGETPQERNIISGNLHDGIIIVGLGSGTVSGNVIIEGNYIGTDPAGTADVGNGRNGIHLINVADNTIGGTASGGGSAGNTIAFNGNDGVMIDDSTTPGNSTGNLISRNLMFRNHGLGIELLSRQPDDQHLLLTNDALDADTGANNLQNYPEITKLVRSGDTVTVDGFLQSGANENFTIEFFSNHSGANTGMGESGQYIQNVVVGTDANGNATFHVVLALNAGDFLSMTATDSHNNTSEISQDRDGDGLLDSWETAGIDANNDGKVDLNLANAGAKIDHKDIFVEVDYMQGHQPVAGALSDVTTAFSNSPVTNPNGMNGITLHPMLDEQVTEVQALAFQPVAGANNDFFDLKTNFFGTSADRADANSANILAAKKIAFRYCIFADSQVGTTSSGIAEVGGNDFMVTLGGWDAASITSAGGQRAAEASTFMHEMGHTLGLRHGGGDDLNGKPNYLSIMNYSLQFPDIDPGRPLDYSTSQLATLDENHLDEAVGVVGPAGRNVVYSIGTNNTPHLAPTNSPINWNGNGVANEHNVAVDINNIKDVNAADGLETQTGYNDWINLQYNYRGDAQYANGVEANASADDTTPDAVVLAAQSVDFDGDGIVNAVDNAPGIFNPNQAAHNGVADVLAKKSVTFQDQDGDLVTVKLTGDGLFTLTLNDPGHLLKGSIGGIELVNTDKTSSLSISVVQANGGNGLVDLGTISGTGLKSISAPVSDLTGGIDLSGWLGSLKLHDILSGADVIAGGAFAQASTIAVHSIGDGTTIDFGSMIKSIAAASIGAGAIDAPSIGSIVIKGDSKLHIQGDFGDSLTLSGTGVAVGKPTLGSAAISGNFQGAVWAIAGSMGNLSIGGSAGGLTPSQAITVKTTGSMGTLLLGQAFNANFLAGVDPTVQGDSSITWRADTIQDFVNTTASIKSISIHPSVGVAGPDFVNSNFSAEVIGAVSVVDATFLNDQLGKNEVQDDFGFWTIAIKGVKYVDTANSANSWAWTPLSQTLPVGLLDLNIQPLV